VRRTRRRRDPRRRKAPSIGPPNQPPGAYPDLSGRIFAVDGLAQEFSEWPDADATHAAITLTTHGIAEAKDCLSG
jgi:hypothetical protein